MRCLQRTMKIIKNKKKYWLLLLSIFFCSSIFLVAQNSNKWIVVTTINYPTKALKKLSELDGWQLIVIGDKKTPLDWHLDNCIYLGVKEQLALHYKIIDLLPWNHYSRKNIGYLYAIEHGAEVVYDTDDDNILIDSNLVVLPKDEQTLIYSGSESVMNPYIYFGSNLLWPRGYPLSKILTNGVFLGQEKSFSLSTDNIRPYIQQGLANLDPDVDAILRLTKGVGTIVFDDSKKPISLPKQCLCPFNTQNTIIHHEAFWGLLIPITTAFRVCDIWRGYWAQRLLWDIDGNICFTKATVVQERNEHNLIHDFIDEIDLYTNVEPLISLLLDWKSDNKSFFCRMQELTDSMIAKDFYKKKERHVLDAWLEDLQKIGYKEPFLETMQTY